MAKLPGDTITHYEYDSKGNINITITDLIRCKDCKWCSEHYDTDGNVPYWICINWDAGTDADGFCHEAELRGEKNETN